MGVSTTAIAAPSVKAEASEDATGLSDIDIACGGQAWGAETAECLATIARTSGRSDARKVRLIADAQAQMTTPNVF
jgi:hypothetical protein